MKIKITYTFILALFISLCNVSGQMRVHLINVGQGCATLIEFPCGAILIDAGGESNALFNSSDSLKAYLDNFFDRRTDLHHTLQCVYLTHPHTDHTRGVAVILQPPFIIKNAVTDGLESDSAQKRLHQAVQKAEENDDPNDDIGFEAMTTGKIGSSGFTNAVIDPVNCAGTDPVIKILWGTSVNKPSTWNDDDFDNPNNHSLVIRVEYGTSSLLITGDLEDVAQRSLLAKYNGSTLLDADVYVVGHHGSKNGSSLALLNKITPKWALIGVGDPNRQVGGRTAWGFGHPNKDILNRLQDKITLTRSPINILAGTAQMKFVPYPISKAIYATGWDNDIILQADENGNWQKLSKLVPNLVNINTAPLSELLTLPGIGETKARAIIQFRTDHGNFTSIDQIDDVPGIGPSTINLIRPYIKL